MATAACYRRRVSRKHWLTLAVLCGVIAGCDHDPILSPRAAHDERDQAAARAVEAQLRTLPGVVRVSAALHSPFQHPLSAAAAAPALPSAAIAVVVDDTAAGNVATQLRTLASAALPAFPIEAISLVVAEQARPAVRMLGPFSVDAKDYPRWRTLAIVLLSVCAAAAAISAYRSRPQRSVSMPP
jgi:hypothetical protein